MSDDRRQQTIYPPVSNRQEPLYSQGNREEHSLHHNQRGKLQLSEGSTPGRLPPLSYNATPPTSTRLLSASASRSLFRADRTPLEPIASASTQNLAGERSKRRRKCIIAIIALIILLLLAASMVIGIYYATTPSEESSSSASQQVTTLTPVTSANTTSAITTASSVSTVRTASSVSQTTLQTAATTLSPSSVTSQANIQSSGITSMTSQAVTQAGTTVTQAGTTVAPTVAPTTTAAARAYCQPVCTTSPAGARHNGAFCILNSPQESYNCWNGVKFPDATCPGTLVFNYPTMTCVQPSVATACTCPHG